MSPRIHSEGTHHYCRCRCRNPAYAWRPSRRERGRLRLQRRSQRRCETRSVSFLLQRQVVCKHHAQRCNSSFSVDHSQCLSTRAPSSGQRRVRLQTIRPLESCTEPSVPSRLAHHPLLPCCRRRQSSLRTHQRSFYPESFSLLVFESKFVLRCVLCQSRVFVCIRTLDFPSAHR